MTRIAKWLVGAGLVPLTVAIFGIRVMCSEGDRGAALFLAAFATDTWRKQSNGEVRRVETPLGPRSVRVFGSGTGRRTLLVHGLSPAGFDHPGLLRLARAVAAAGDGPVLVPDFGELRQLQINERTRDEIRSTVVALAAGREYDVVGICAAGSLALAALTALPAGQQPRRFVLFGGVSSLKSLVAHFNETTGADLYARLILVALQSDNRTRDSLLYAASRLPPGVTDEQEIRRVLDPESILRIRKTRLVVGGRSLDLTTELAARLYRPELFLIHFRGDQFVPFSETQSLCAAARFWPNARIRCALPGGGAHGSISGADMEELRGFLRAWFTRSALEEPRSRNDG